MMENKQKLESLLQNWYVIKNKVTKKEEIIPKYYAVGERRLNDNQNSSRNYGVDANDYICLTNNHSSVDISRDNLSSKRKSNLIKLK